MSNPLIRFVNDRYAQFEKELVTNWALDLSLISGFESHLKPIYKRFLSMSCAATIVAFKARRSEYAQGVVEASMLCFPLVLKGLENPLCVLIRQSIELVLKHIFFSTHPVEYGWAASNQGYRDLGFQVLLEYISRTDERMRIDPSNDICKKLNDCYGSLSRHVHVHNRAFMSYSSLKVNNQPTIDMLRILKKLNERTREVWCILTLLLIVYSPHRYVKASTVEQQLIRSGIPIHLKSAFDQYIAELG